MTLHVIVVKAGFISCLDLEVNFDSLDYNCITIFNGEVGLMSVLSTPPAVLFIHTQTESFLSFIQFILC